MNKKLTFFGVFIWLTSIIVSFSALPAYLDPIIVDELLPPGYAEEYNHRIPISKSISANFLKESAETLSSLESLPPQTIQSMEDPNIIYISSITNNTQSTTLTFENIDTNTYHIVKIANLDESEYSPAILLMNYQNNDPLEINYLNPVNPELSDHILLAKLDKETIKFIIEQINMDSPEDQDQDSKDDIFEIYNGTNPLVHMNQDPLDDSDNDGVPNEIEDEIGSDKFVANPTSDLFTFSPLEAKVKNLVSDVKYIYSPCETIQDLTDEWSSLLTQPWQTEHAYFTDCVLNVSDMLANIFTSEQIVESIYYRGLTANSFQQIQKQQNFSLWSTSGFYQPNQIYFTAYFIKQANAKVSFEGIEIGTESVNLISFKFAYNFPQQEPPSGTYLLLEDNVLEVPTQRGHRYIFFPNPDISHNDTSPELEMSQGLLVEPNSEYFFNLNYRHDEDSFPYESEHAIMTVSLENNHELVLWVKDPLNPNSFVQAESTFSWPAHEYYLLGNSIKITTPSQIPESTAPSKIKLTFSQYGSNVSDTINIFKATQN